MKRFLCIALSLMLVLGTTALGEAEESVFGTLYDAAAELAFNTSNVSLSAEADFYYDGELFKTMHTAYRQDGVKSFLSYMLDTPDIYGEVSTNGYIVLGLGDRCFAGDKYFGYYYEAPTKVTDKILKSNARTDAQVRIGRGLALMAEALTETTKDGTAYTFSAGKLPSLINDAVYYMLLDYIQDNYYTDVFGIYNSSYNNATTYTDDWFGLIALKYREIYGEELPDMDQIYDSDTLFGRYSVAINAVNQFENEASAPYTSGIVNITADGSVYHYDTEEEFMLATNRINLYYGDWTKAFMNYYKLETGEDISEETIDYIIYSPNPELWEAYDEFVAQMADHYKAQARAQDENAVTAVIMPDGSVKTFDYIVNSEDTVTRRIFQTMSFAALDSLNASVETDDAGRLTALAGEIKVEITDKNGKSHELKIEFDCKAYDYDTTEVEDVFEPQKYGFISMEEWEQKYYELHNEDDYDGQDAWEQILANDPGKVSFLGKTYETMLNEGD